MKLIKEQIALLEDIKNLLKDIKMALIREPYDNYIYPYYPTDSDGNTDDTKWKYTFCWKFI